MLRKSYMNFDIDNIRGAIPIIKPYGGARGV